MTRASSGMLSPCTPGFPPHRIITAPPPCGRGFPCQEATQSYKTFSVKQSGPGEVINIESQPRTALPPGLPASSVALSESVPVQATSTTKQDRYVLNQNQKLSLTSRCIRNRLPNGISRPWKELNSETPDTKNIKRETAAHPSDIPASYITTGIAQILNIRETTGYANR